MNFAGMEKIIIDIMSIQSMCEIIVGIRSDSIEDVNACITANRIPEVIKRSCKVNRRPPVELEVIMFEH